MLFLFPTYNEEFASQIYEVIYLGNISESESSLYSSIGKTHFSSWAFLSRVSPLLSHFISDTSGHQTCADFPPPSSPSTLFGYPTIEFNFIQFWEYLLRGSVRWSDGVTIELWWTNRNNHHCLRSISAWYFYYTLYFAIK